MSEHLRIHPKYHEAIKAAQLTPKQALVLDLYLKHHSIRSIARAHGWSESNARGHLDAALRKIRPHITPSRKHGNDLEAQQRVEIHQNKTINRAYRTTSNTRARKHNATSERLSRTDIIARDNRTCHICGKPNLANNEIHLDHVIPLSKGGSHTADNIKVACAPCNIRKGANTP